MSLPAPIIASEFYTDTEVQAQFKKVKKKERKMRKKPKIMSAADLMPLGNEGEVHLGGRG